MEFRILGPLEVLQDGQAVELGAAKQRALFVVLLLEANRVVSSDRLIASLWGERPPETAQKALQVYVSHLRKLLGKDRIRTRAPGYELRLDSGELDLDRFHALVSMGDFEAALALWRGPPLADFAYEPFAQAEIARLEELHVACLEQRIERDLAQGRHAALVGEVESLVRAHPLRERLRAQLMLALYRSGRQAEALDAYQAGRSLLAEELGLEPGAELKELQRAILAHDPSLAPTEQPGTQEHFATRPDGPRPARASHAREVRKTVTVLVCDVAPTDPRLDPESFRRIAARGFEELSPVLARHGATVERSIGGAVTAIFGIPTVHEDDALRAARAATEIRERLESLRAELEERWGARLELRGGIGTGEVLTGGDEAQPFATGAAVQSALDLHHAAGAGEVLFDERTYRLVRDAVDAERIDGHARLLGARAVARGYPSRFDSPMVGRERERRRLHDAFEQAVVDRSCQLFTILGAPGVGKSRLVREFVDDLSGRALVARGRCLPYGEGITYWPVVEAVRDAAGLDDVESTEETLTKLAAVLAGEEEAELATHRLGQVIGLTEEPSGAEESFWAVGLFVDALARREPLVLVFDDIHWGEPTFLDLIDHIADWTKDAPVLVVAVARPELLELRPHWGGGKLNATSVLLEPLSDAESVELVDNLAAAAELEHPARDRVVEAAGGNPLFVEEMLALLLEEGGTGTAVDVPPTIQALLAARLDRLADGERAVIEAASVEGKLFHESSVADLVGVGAADVQGSLLTLVRKELIRPDRPVFSGERAYQFRHLLIRDAAYESLPKEARATLHERHAGWLEQRAGDRALEFEEILGYHLEQAFRYRSELGPLDDDARDLGRRAAERLGIAGRRAFLRSDAPAGVNLISRSVLLIPPDDPFRVELVPNVRAVQGVSDLGWADRVLTEAIEAAATSGDRTLAAHALVQRGFLRLFTGSEVTPAELFDVARRAIAIFETLDDELGLARAWRLVAQAHYLDSDAAGCARASERALVHARRAGDRFEMSEIVEWLVIALLFGPMPAREALARCRGLLGEEWDDFLLPAEISSAAATLAAMLGRTEEAHELVRRSRVVMTEAAQWVWIVTFWHSYISVWYGDPAAAEEELRPAYDALKRIGDASHFNSIAHALSNAVYLQGRYAEAEALTEECERASGSNDIYSQILWRSTRAKTLARRGAFETARELAQEAVALGEASDFLLAHADALADLSEVLALEGRGDEARPVLEAAIRRYEDKGNVLAATAARAWHARLGAV